MLPNLIYSLLYCTKQDFSHPVHLLSSVKGSPAVAVDIDHIILPSQGLGFLNAGDSLQCRDQPETLRTMHGSNKAIIFMGKGQGCLLVPP